jgi:hypothetical protein
MREAEPSATKRESARTQPQSGFVQNSVHFEVPECRSAGEPQPGDPVRPDLSCQPRRHQPEQFVEGIGGQFDRQFHGRGHQHRRCGGTKVHIVQNGAGAIQSVVVPTDITCGQPDVAELAHRESADVEPRVEFGDGQGDVALIETH